jgi:predicted phosphodiesterase
MGISMKKRYVVTLVVVGAVVLSGYIIEREIDYLFHDELEYPVYDGEELFKTEVYPYKFAYVGDSRPESVEEVPEVFKTVIQMINKDNPLFVIGGGDFVLEGTPEYFEEFLTYVSALNPHLFYVCGNHDDSPDCEEYLGERVYAFTYKTCIFIILDNSKKVLDGNQLHFLEDQLKKGFEHTFVFLHVPPFDPEGRYSMIHPEEFMEIVLTYEVDYVFSSHIHSFYERKRGNTIFVISGGAGSPIRRGGYFHYILIDVKDTITYTVRCVP